MLEIKKLSLIYDRVIISELNFSSSSSRIAIVGKSGRGKSSLVRIILGLKKADGGSINHNYKKISTVFQNDLLIDSLNACQNIKIASNKSDSEIMDLLKRLEINDFKKKLANFSGGMKRRVAIARALLNDDFDLLVLDEPFNGLDPQTKELTKRVILDCIRNKDLVLISHDENDLKSFEISDILYL